MPERKSDQTIWMDWAHFVVGYEFVDHGHLNLYRLFDFVAAGEPLPDCALIFRLGAAPGIKLEHHLRVRPVDPDEQPMLGPDGRPLPELTAKTVFVQPVPSLPAVAVRPIPLRNWVFHKTGRHRFEVYLDDAFIDSVSITVLEKPDITPESPDRPPSPDDPRTGGYVETPESASTRARLSAIVGEIWVGLSGPKFPAKDPGDPGEVQVVHVAFVYLRKMLAHGRAVLTLSNTALAETAYSNLRSLFEIYTDFRYLLYGEDMQVKVQRARRAVLYGMWELLESLQELGAAKETIDRHAARLDATRAADPETFDRVKRDRKDTRTVIHWSGTSRKKLMESLGSDADGLKHLYEVLSWQSHNVLGVLVDIGLTGSTNATMIAPSHSPQEICTVVCVEAAKMLEDAWRGIQHHGWTTHPT